MATFLAHRVLRPTPWCVARELEDRYLVYNVKTDEMHLIPAAGYYVYQLCDGLRSVSELEAQLAPTFGVSADKAKECLRAFIDQLVARGILADDGAV